MNQLEQRRLYHDIACDLTQRAIQRGWLPDGSGVTTGSDGWGGAWTCSLSSQGVAIHLDRVLAAEESVSPMGVLEYCTWRAMALVSGAMRKWREMEEESGGVAGWDNG